MLRYLSRVGVVKYTCHSGYLSTVINENDLATVLTPAGGIFCALRVPGQEVEYGDTIGEILDPFSIKPLNKSLSHRVREILGQPHLFLSQKSLEL